MKTNTDLVKFCEKYVGGYYWFGTIAGMVPTQKLLDTKKVQYPTHYTANRIPKYKKAIAENAKISDCTGLIKGYLMQVNGHYVYNCVYDMNDTGLLNDSTMKGDMATMPEVPGLGLWKSGHVAVYVGNGYIIEAAGFSYGIRKVKLDKTRFKKWFYIKDINYNINKPSYDIDSLAQAVIRGEYGNGLERKQKLNALGYGLIYDQVQARVNQLIYRR